MSNAVTTVTAAQLAQRCAKHLLFKAGYDSYIKGKPFDYSQSDKSMYYERGRLFAIYTLMQKTPRAVWRDGVMSKAARERLVHSVQSGYVR
jgi:hypothetical protein